MKIDSYPPFLCKRASESDKLDDGQIVVRDPDYQLCKGALKDLPVLVKKYDNDSRLAGNPYKDIAIGSQMSVHKTVLKVLGCCLETEKPTIVYEFARTKSLSTCISATNVQPLPWKSRMKIAIDLANAIAYLHTAFCRPVIHRDIKCSSIIVDQNNVPKLIDYGLCISIPEGQSYVKTGIAGKMGMMPPEVFRTDYLTEKADVYHFGMFLIELLSGRKPVYTLMEHGSFENFSNVVDPRITQEGFKSEHFLDFGTLIQRCIYDDREERPTMIDVAKELRRIYQSSPST
ncbi:hypothetical protein PTKIN_Ptkin06aG0207500 [Pterospermum kingtungense]